MTSRMSRGQTVFALCWLPVHLLGLPLLAGLMMLPGWITEAQANVLVYAVGALAMLLALHGFFRRDFDALCERPGGFVLDVLSNYGLLWLCTLAAGMLLAAFGMTDNANNDEVASLLTDDYGPVAAMAVFLAPLLEEPIFRGAIFGALRRKSRLAAYLVSAGLFALYHVWAYALSDASAWLYLLQYIPAGLVLCRCYERTDSIWGSVFVHMLNNGVAVLLGL